MYEYLLAACILFFPEIALASSADERAMEGMKFYRKNAFDQASQKFLEARKGKPDDPKISYNLGNSHYKQGMFENALQDYSRSADHKHNSTVKQKSAYNIGNTLYRMNKLEESIAAYKKALEIDPSDMDAKFNLEFVREQIKKKNKEQKKQAKSEKNQKDKQSNDQKDKNKNQSESDQQNQTKNQNNSSNPSNQSLPPFQNKQEQKNSQNSPPAVSKALQEKINKEEAEQKLSALTEDLKKFQRKQALDMKSIFTYQGNDW